MQKWTENGLKLANYRALQGTQGQGIEWWCQNFNWKFINTRYLAVSDKKLSFLPHLHYLKNKCTKALNLLRVVAHTSWGADQQSLLHLYRSLVRSKLDYGCIVYGSARGSYLQMLDPIQNHALRLCLGAYRTSPSSSLRVLANEPLYIRRKLFIQYCLKLSSSPQNPTYNTVFNCKFKDLFEQKPNQIPLLSIRVQPDLRAIGFIKRNALVYSIPATPPWLLKRPHINWFTAKWPLFL